MKKVKIFSKHSYTFLIKRKAIRFYLIILFLSLRNFAHAQVQNDSISKPVNKGIIYVTKSTILYNLENVYNAQIVITSPVTKTKVNNNTKAKAHSVKRTKISKEPKTPQVDKKILPRIQTSKTTLFSLHFLSHSFAIVNPYPKQAKAIIDYTKSYFSSFHRHIPTFNNIVKIPFVYRLNYSFHLVRPPPLFHN